MAWRGDVVATHHMLAVHAFDEWEPLDQVHHTIPDGEHVPLVRCLIPLSSSISSNSMTPISSFNASLVIFKPPAMMMLGAGAGAWPCDEARAALRWRSRWCTNCLRVFVAH